MSDSEEETVTDFGSVLQGELEYIYRHAPHPRQKERAEKFAETLNALRDPQQLRDAVQADPDLQLSGLAFSGGGIRSAAFGLGAIQSLARAGLISRFDFLSGVSGGGYILGWLLAWAYRIAGGLPSMERKLSEQNATGETKAVNHLRRYVVYLAPKGSLLSGDLWALIAAYLRNLSVSLAFALPLLLVPILIAYLVFAGIRVTVENHAAWWQQFGFAALLVLAAAELVAMRLFARDIVPRDWIGGPAASRYLLRNDLGWIARFASYSARCSPPPPSSASQVFFTVG